MGSTGDTQNRLADEKSPYLLQHAHNPVDWYPWGEEAFEKARRETKPIFLSVGYSTCHWCHVMAHESFESEEVASIMNRDFVNIKVDREERPDVDRVYMTFVQATTGRGGWPMSVWLTPELKPFVGGTYFPPEDRYGHPGFKKVLEGIATAWKRDQAKIAASGQKIVEALREAQTKEAGRVEDLGATVFNTAYEQFDRVFDPVEGGFGNAPKFPHPVTLNFLTRFYARNVAQVSNLPSKPNQSSSGEPGPSRTGRSPGVAGAPPSMSPLEVMQTLNQLGGKHGIGRVDIVENRYVGMKSRGIYETPGGAILHFSHRQMEGLTMDREVMHLRDSLIPKYSELIYNGYWFSPEREALQALVTETQRNVTGTVRLKLYKGNVIVAGRKSPKSLYNPRVATMEGGGSAYNQSDATGFINLNALRLKMRVAAQSQVRSPGSPS